MKTPVPKKACRLLAALVVLVGISVAASSCTIGARPGNLGATLNAAGGAFPTAPLQPPAGFIFTQYSAPLDIFFTEEGVPTTAQPGAEGVAEAHYVRIPLFSPNLSFAWEDVSIEAAARNGNISTVHYADYEVLSVLGIYTNTKVKVYGN